MEHGLFKHFPVCKVLVTCHVIKFSFYQVNDVASELLALYHWNKRLNRLFEGSFNLVSIESSPLYDDVVLVHETLSVDHRADCEL